MLGSRARTIAMGATVVALTLGSAPASARTLTADRSPTMTVTSPAALTSSPVATTSSVEPNEPNQSAPPTSEADGLGEQLSPEALAQQVAEADALRQSLAGSTSEIAAAAARLEQLSAQSNTLLQRYAAARDAEKSARADAERNIAVFEKLRTQAADDRQAIGRWAYEAYSGGGSFAELSTILDTLSSDPQRVTDQLAQLDYIGELRQKTYGRAADSAVTQRGVAAQAVEDTTAAAKATEDADQARQELTVITTQQQAQLTSLRSLHSEQASRGSALAGLLIGQGSEDAARASKQLRKSLNLTDISAAFVGQACTDDEADYANGQIPPSALCPLYKAPGESLRPAAAAAFNALSQAYEKDTGSPICVTDSYRSYAEQVQVKGDRGRFAATPGTSEHGRGLALDLCGGINDFGAPAHLWMKQNAPLFGWFHPSWAEASGNLPEPWHWEFAG